MHKTAIFLENLFSVLGFISILTFSTFVSFNLNPDVKKEDNTANVAGVSDNKDNDQQKAEITIHNLAKNTEEYSVERSKDGGYQKYIISFNKLNSKLELDFLKVTNLSEYDTYLEFESIIEDNLKQDLNIELKRDLDTLIMDKPRFLTFRSLSESNVKLSINPSTNINYNFKIVILVK